MLGIVLLIFVGRAFYMMAERYQKSPWPIAILGVVSYYAGLLLGGFLIGIIAELTYPGWVENTNEYLLGAMGIPLGVLTCWLTFHLLRKSWSKPSEIDKNTLDGGFIENKDTQ